ncbi:HAD family hydrolase [Streptomyces sp. NPDC056004]|uniref:HAD family hydrolase n=1 Tax=Streptomyces sp. NPDC056004 TaxID=3345677 RepID=UPI0035D723DF
MPEGRADGRAVRGVVFDLDGTLVDSWDVHRHALRHAAAEAGMGEPSSARLAAAQRPTDLATVRALVGDACLATAWPAYRREFLARLGIAPPRATAHAAETLRRLRASGLSIGVCTGRSRREAQALLDVCALDVPLVIAREQAAPPKPAPTGLLAAVRALGLATREALYVGDTAADLRQGSAAGVQTLVLGARGARPRGQSPGSHLSELSELLAHTGCAERRAE